jgi:sulfite reductase (NADPH) hemoprotein beta-component
MAKKIKGPQLVIANRLDDGRVVFLKECGEWSVNAADAAVAEAPEALDKLEALGKEASSSNFVVDPQLVPAETGDAISPAHMKQAMQAKGPSVRPDLGYQVSHDWEGQN